ncbi:MAG: polysulfide reductase NrfD, partial [Elusimicrobia bacterium]|nr:polysulfide reductase NrfD [Elusimicrobiota bacterium]
MRPRNWIFYVQLAGFAGFCLFAVAANGWFAWRAVASYRLGDAWLPAVVMGGIIGPVFLLLSWILSRLFFKIVLRETPPGRSPAHLEILPAEEALVAPIFDPPTGRFLATTAVLACVSLWALFAWCYQMYYGLTVTGLNNPVFWGFYITNFVFFIGISHAGTLISAILRIVQAEWRRSITRSAEV